MTSREGTRHLPGDDQERKNRPAFRETLRRQFREFVKAITDKAPAPDPKPSRRKRTDETRGGFIMAARRVAYNARHILRQFCELATAATSQPAEPPVLDIPSDPYDDAERLLLWQIEQWRSNADDMQQQTDFDYPANTLSLHL